MSVKDSVYEQKEWKTSFKVRKGASGCGDSKYLKRVWVVKERGVVEGVRVREGGARGCILHML